MAPHSLPCNKDFDFDEELICLTIISRHVLKKKRRKIKKKRYWVNEYLKERKTKGRFYVDFPDMVKSPLLFKENFRMTEEQFNCLLNLIEGDLSAIVNTRNDSIPPKEQLAVTLEYLASGTILRHLSSVYRISKQRIGTIIKQTCEAIVSKLGPLHMPKMSQAAWINVANRYNYRWNMPNCLGSIDGKHCAIRCPKNAGSSFYNYKGFHSILLMAVADADYKFIYYDVGAYGSEGDSSVFRDSTFGRALFNRKLDIPSPKIVFGKPLPFFFLGDDAFPLDRHIQKPYKPATKHQPLILAERLFNYRLSRARRTVENAFGILCSRWMCLARTMTVSPDSAQKIIAACCILHNYLMDTGKEEYAPTGFSDLVLDDGSIIDGYWRERLHTNSMYHNSCGPTSGRLPENAKDIRNHLKNYFISPEGQVPWQEASVLFTC